MINSFTFCLFGKVFLPPFLKENFYKQSILGWLFCTFNTMNASSHYFLACKFLLKHPLIALWEFSYVRIIFSLIALTLFSLPLILDCFIILCFVLFCFFPCPWYVEVPEPGIKPEPHHWTKLLQWQRQILNLLCHKRTP